MADTSISVSFTVNKDSLKRSYSRSGTSDFTATAPYVTSGSVSIGTTHEALVMQDVSTAGLARFENLDTTNYVEIGVLVSSTFYPFLKLKAGEFQFVRLGTSAPYAKANTAAVRLDYEIFQE